MRLVTYLRHDDRRGTSFQRRHDGRVAGLVATADDDVVVDLYHAAQQRGERLPVRMLDLIEAGPAAWEVARQLLAEPPEAAPARAEVRLLAPLPDPPSLRDFYAFEDHVRRGFATRGQDVPPAWFDLPVYYLTNHRSILGPGETIPWPPFTRELDYELEIAMVVGLGGRHIAATDAAAHVFGYTLYNDCSARDLQRREMEVRLGPARSKGFAQVLGPCIVTPDELDVTDLRVTARIDGDVVTDTTTSDMRWSFEQMLAYVSAGEDVIAGDVYGSGTVAGGCGLEHGRMLAPGETIELAAPAIGRLANPVGYPEPVRSSSARGSADAAGASRSIDTTSTS